MGPRKNSSLICSVLILVVIFGSILMWIFNDQPNGKRSSRFISSAPLGVYEKAAVATNGPECSKIGADVLKQNGSAVDAAIAALLCEGVASLHSMGLGGGFLMTIYDSSKKKAYYLNARETAPKAATQDMFQGNANLSLYGGLAVAVPGELKGYWEAHQRFGKLPWKKLFEPTIKLCLEGHTVTKYLEQSIKGQEYFIQNEPTLSTILIDPMTNKTYRQGDKIRRPVLAETLKKLSVAENAAQLFYNSSMTDELVKEIKDHGGNIEKEDFVNYEVTFDEATKVNLGKHTVFTVPPPGSGPILIFMLHVLKDLVSVEDEKVLWQRIVETCKWAYAKRSDLGDPKFVDISEVMTNLTSNDYAEAVKMAIKDDRTYYDPKHYQANFTMKDDHGTAHVSVLAPDGSAVSVTSTINQVLGAKFRSSSTGIIFNDEMDDFSSPNMTNGFDLPPSPNNFIRPGKQPMSSMAPTIVLGENETVRLVIGAAGGSKITSAVSAITIFHLYKNYNVKEATDAFRLHHQLLPMKIEFEKNFPNEILNYLYGIGHNMTEYTGIGSAVTVISKDPKDEGKIMANSDYRREGTTSGF